MEPKPEIAESSEPASNFERMMLWLAFALVMLPAPGVATSEQPPIEPVRSEISQKLVFEDDLIIRDGPRQLSIGPSSRGLSGTWIGTFNGQPLDGERESVTPFRLRIRQKGNSITGSLTILGGVSRTSPITKGICDPNACSFEVLDFSDADTPSAWRVWTDLGKLEGTHNRGPLSPFTGIGVGVRLFAIAAHRSR
jgi:hypothetical protein